MNDWHEISIEAKREKIPLAVEFVEEVMTASRFDRRRILEVQLAVEEAFTNTALHGYRDNKGIIRICSRDIDDGMEVVIEDDGLPFDPTKLAAPVLTDDVEKRPIGGLGVHLMRKFMDGLKYEFKDGKNNLILTIKRRNSINTFILRDHEHARDLFFNSQIFLRDMPQLALSRDAIAWTF